MNMEERYKGRTARSLEARNRLESMASQAVFSLIWSRGSTNGVWSRYEGSSPSGDFGLVLVDETGFRELVDLYDSMSIRSSEVAEWGSENRVEELSE